MTEAELDRRLFNGEAVEAALELFAENQRLLSSEPSEGERETRRRVASAAFNIGSLIVDKRDAEIARLRAEVERLREWAELVLSWAHNPDKSILDHGAVEQACLHALFPGKGRG